MEHTFLTLLWLPIGYLLGSCSFSWLVARVFRVKLAHATVSELGRRGGFRLAGIAVLGEIGKAWIAVTLAFLIAKDPWATALSGLGAILGHSFPAWLMFRVFFKGATQDWKLGGKAMSAGCGALAALWVMDSPETGRILLLAGGIALSAWLITWWVSAGSLSATFTTLGIAVLWDLPLPYRFLLIAGGVVALFRLSENLGRVVTLKEHVTPPLWLKPRDIPAWLRPPWPWVQKVFAQ